MVFFVPHVASFFSTHSSVWCSPHSCFCSFMCLARCTGQAIYDNKVGMCWVQLWYAHWLYSLWQCDIIERPISRRMDSWLSSEEWRFVVAHMEVWNSLDCMQWTFRNALQKDSPDCVEEWRFVAAHTEGWNSLVGMQRAFRDALQKDPDPPHYANCIGIAKLPFPFQQLCLLHITQLHDILSPGGEGTS